MGIFSAIDEAMGSLGGFVGDQARNGTLLTLRKGVPVWMNHGAAAATNFIRQHPHAVGYGLTAGAAGAIEGPLTSRNGRHRALYTGIIAGGNAAAAYMLRQFGPELASNIPFGKIKSTLKGAK